MSFDAVRWALDQPVDKSSAKFVLVAMADCVNAEGGEMLCWPSYAFLARRTGQDHKTVEAGVHRLKESGFIVDTGVRRGDTGKVVVYRLNVPKNGAIKSGPHAPETGDVQGANSPENGVITAEGNPPKFPVQSPQISQVIPPNFPGNPPKNGVQNKERTRNGTKKEPGISEIPGVPPNLLSDWLKVRKDKKAGPITETVIDGLVREASKAGLSVADAVRYCCEAGWQGFNAGFYAKREGKGTPQATKAAGKHTGFDKLNYRDGVNPDGSFT